MFAQKKKKKKKKKKSFCSLSPRTILNFVQQKFLSLFMQVNIKLKMSSIVP